MTSYLSILHSVALAKAYTTCLSFFVQTRYAMVSVLSNHVIFSIYDDASKDSTIRIISMVCALMDTEEMENDDCSFVNSEPQSLGELALNRTMQNNSGS